MGPTHTPKSTPKRSKPAGMTTGLKAKTPEPAKDIVIVTKKTPKSAPPAKRKKLSQEIDDQISDEEFENVYQQVKSNEKEKKLTGKITPKKTPRKDIENLLDAIDSDDESDDDDFEANMDSDDDDDSDVENGKDTSDDEDDDDESDDDEGSDEDEEEGSDMDDDNESAEDDSEEIAAPKEKEKKTKKAKKSKPEDGSGDAKVKVSEKAAADIAKFNASRNIKTLFISQLPDKTGKSDIKSLVPDCIEIDLKKSKNKNHAKRLYAMISFSDEATTDKYYKKLQNTKVKDQAIVVDYVGAKSKRKPVNLEPTAEDLDPIRLFVNGLSKSITMDILKSHFPDAVEVRIPLRAKTQKVIGFGFIEFKSPKICDAALEKMQGTTILDRTIQLFHAKKQSGKKRTMETKKDDFVGAKRMKMEDGDIKKKSPKKSKTKKRKATADK